VTVTGGLPAGWTAADIGNPAVVGGTSYNGSAFTVDGGGLDIWDASDQFRFVYRQASGDVDIVARVATIENVNVWTKGGVMIRATPTGSAANAMTGVSSASGLLFSRRLTTGGLSSSTKTTGQAPAWVKLARRGNAITGYRSSDGVSWTVVGTDTITLPATFYVGLAVTSHDGSNAATMVFDSVSVSTPTANQAPTVSLTAPTAGSSYTAPAGVTVSATASDTDGTISKVDFYANATLIGTDTTAPYSVTWNSVAGTHSLTAVATDNRGGTATSAARTVTVAAGANQPPTVSLTAPASGASYSAPASVTISATAAAAVGTIARVDFYQGSTLVGSDTSAPYSVAWSNVPAGTYSLIAVARDSAGASTTSAARTVTVTAAQSPSTAVFVPSSNHATAVSNYVLEIFTAGTNTTGATPLATQNLGKPAVVNGECSANISSAIAALPSGNYVATVSAVGAGGTARSAPSAPFSR
jgi:hypothetical protein